MRIFTFTVCRDPRFSTTIKAELVTKEARDHELNEILVSKESDLKAAKAAAASETTVPPELNEKIAELKVSIKDLKARLEASKVSVNINDLMSFIFPSDLQHPLAAARLFIFCEYGPLIENQLRSGISRRHTLAVWELDAMCINAEREDVIKIFLHRSSDYGMLAAEEQEAIIQQADGHLKKAKGKSMLPVLTKNDFLTLLSELKRDEYGDVNFHEIQNVVAKYRHDRIQV
jgi:hypothetical protein